MHGHLGADRRPREEEDEDLWTCTCPSWIKLESEIWNLAGTAYLLIKTSLGSKTPRSSLETWRNVPELGSSVRKAGAPSRRKDDFLSKNGSYWFLLQLLLPCFDRETAVCWQYLAWQQHLTCEGAVTEKLAADCQKRVDCRQSLMRSWYLTLGQVRPSEPSQFEGRCLRKSKS